jgi:hypothetical protein
MLFCVLAFEKEKVVFQKKREDIRINGFIWRMDTAPTCLHVQDAIDVKIKKKNLHTKLFSTLRI